MRNRMVVVGGAIAAFVLLMGAIGVHAVGGPGGLPLDRQLLAPIQASMPQTTSSTTWVSVAGYSFSDGPGVVLRGGVAVTLSVTVSGAPASFRIVLEDVRHNFRQIVMKPGSVVFNPAAGPGSFSFVFVRGALGSGPFTVNLLWRSPTGAPTTIHGGTEAIRFAAG